MAHTCCGRKQQPQLQLPQLPQAAAAATVADASS
jgi:hypothetical protein